MPASITWRPTAPFLGGLAVAVTVVTWAAAFPAIRVALDGFGPAALGLARLVVAAVVLAGVAIVLRPPVPPRRMWARVVLAGLVGQTLYQLFLMIGEREVPAGTASMLIATAPLFSVVAAAVLLGESARGRWPGMLVAAAGAVIVGASLDLGGGAFAAAVMVAAAFQGLYHVIVKPLSQAIGAFGATAWSLWAGAVLALPAGPWLAADLATAPTDAITAAVFLGVVPSALGYLTWSFALARAPIVQTTSALYLVPVVALIVAWLWIGEQPALLSVLGGAVAIAGVVLVQRGGSTIDLPLAPTSEKTVGVPSSYVPRRPERPDADAGREPQPPAMPRVQVARAQHVLSSGDR